MPKKSKKSASKRVTLKQKYKVIRKVKEHGRKVAKAARKSGGKAKQPADPGLPNQWPFKQELIKELEEKRQLILAAEKRKKQDRKRTREEARSQGGEEEMADAPSLGTLQAQADSKQEDYATIQKRARKEPATPVQIQERSRRAFYKDFVKVVEAADVILEVVDARDPLAYRCTEVEQFVRSADPNKKIVLLLNKVDLVPREVVEKWLKYFRAELPTVAFKCSTQKQAQNLSQRRPIPGGKGAKKRNSQGTGTGYKPQHTQGSDCLGADTLLQLLKNYARNNKMKTSITVGIVGLPNVGKSSLINSLKRARVVNVGNAPGVTRSLQEVHLDKQLKLVDSPGIVFSAGATPAASALRNCVKVEQLIDPVLPVSDIVAKCPQQQLMSVYKIPAFKDVDQFLQMVAAARGKLSKGGTVDVNAAARIVLSDWNDGRIPFFTEPPERARDSHADAAIVADWSAEFQADEVFAAEQSAVLQGLRSQIDMPHFSTPTTGQPAVDMAALDAEHSAAEVADSMDIADVSQVLPNKMKKASQVETLYKNDGQLNPHARRNEKKQAKKAKMAAPVVDDGSGSDFDLDQ